MTQEEIKSVVKKFMDSDEDGFVKNSNGVFMYSAGHHSFNLEILLEDFLEYTLEERRTNHGE